MLASRGGVVRGRSKARGSTRAASTAAGTPSTRGGRGGTQASPAATRGGPSLRRGSATGQAGLRGRGTSAPLRGNISQPQQPGIARGGIARAPITRSKLKKPAPNADLQTRYEIFKENRNIERADAIKNGFIADPDRPRTLAEAITPVGTCPDMCAEWERLERIVQNDVWGAEYDPEASDAQGKRVPDEARMVKKFRRAAAGLDEQLPSDLRPPPVLQKTLDYLFNELLGSSAALSQVHHFIWDRTRAVRNDFSIQQVSRVADLQITIQCYERIARFHILSLHQLALSEKPYDKYDAQQEREQLDKTLLSLMQLYDDSRARVMSPNEPEFRAYCVIFQIQNSIPDLEDRVQTWPGNVANHPRVQRALRLYAAATNTADAQGPLKPRIAHPIAQANWRRFWSLVKSKEISYLMACVAEIYFPLVRRTALNAIWQSYRASSTRKMEDWTLDELIEVFGLESEEQVQDLCISYGFTIAERDDGVAYLDLNSVPGRSLPDPPAGSHAQRKSEFVEQKRFGRALSAVINGLSVHAAQTAGLVEHTNQQSLHTGRSSSEKGKSLFITDESDDEKTPPSSATRNTFGQPSSFNPFASSFVPTPAAAPLQQSQNTTSNSTFGSNKTQSSAVSISNPSPFSFGAQSKALSAFNAQPLAACTTFVDNQSSLPSFGGTATSAIIKSSPFAQLQNPNQEPTRPQQISEEPKSFPTSVKQNMPTPAFGANPLPSFNFGQPGTPLNAQKLETPSTNSPVATFKPPIEGKALQSSPLATQSPSFNWDTINTVNTTLDAKQSVPSFTFASSTSAAQSPLPTTFSQPTSLPSPTPSTTFTQPATLTAPLSDNQRSTSHSPLQTAQQPLSTGSEFGLPNSSQQRPAPTVSAPSIEELQRIARIKEAAEARKSILLGQVAEALVVEKYGLLEQFVEYTATSLIHKARQQVINERATMQADEFRLAVLSQRYGRRWRQVCLNRRLARQGRERRQRLARNVEARNQRSRESSITSQIDAFRDTFKSGRSSLSSSNAKHENLSEPFGEGGPSSSMPAKNESWASASQTSNISFASTTRSNSFNALDRITPYSSALTPRTSRRVRDSSLAHNEFRLTSTTPRQDTTRSTYFKLKAMGLDPNSTTLHTSTASAPTMISNERKRPRTDSIDSLSGLGKRPFAASRSLLASHSPSQDEANQQSASSSKSKVTIHDANDDDEILLAARQVRQAMAESMTLFQDEIAKDEKRKFESSQSNAVTARKMSKSLGAQDFGVSFQSTASTSFGGRTSRFAEPPPKYRSRVSKFLPRERYADIQAHRRSTISTTPRITPSTSRRSDTINRAVALASTVSEAKGPVKTDQIIDLDDDDEPEVRTNGWHSNEREPTPFEVNQFGTPDPMLATYAPPAMYAPIQYESQPILPYTAETPPQELAGGRLEPHMQEHVDQVPDTMTFSPTYPPLHDDALSNLAHQAAQFVPQHHRSPSLEPANVVSSRYPTPPPPPSAVDEEVEVLHVQRRSSSPKHQPVPSPPGRLPSPIHQTQPAPREITKQRQVSQPKRPHHRQPSAPHVNPFALLAGMEDEDDDDDEEEVKDVVDGGYAGSVGEEAEDDIVEDEEPGSEAEEEEHEFVDEKGGPPVDGHDNGYYEEDEGQYDEEHGFNDDSNSGNGRYSVDDDVEVDGEEGDYDVEEEEDSVEDDDEEEDDAPPPPAWDGKGGSAEDAIEL